MTDVLSATYTNNSTSVAPSPNPSAKRRRDGSTATFDSTSSFDLNESRDTVHDVATSTPSSRHNFSAQTEPPLHMSAQPKYEAFVMTGDKILNLNPKISPSYAKLQRTQLPPNVEVENQPKYSKAFENFPSTTFQKKKYSRSHANSANVSVSNSENLLNNNNQIEASNKTVNLIAEACASSNEIPTVPASSSANRVNSLSREPELMNGSENNVSVMHEISMISQSQPPPPAMPLPSPFNYTGLRIDAGLRDFLEHVPLSGESTERARILKHFADRYYDCNPTLFDGPDSIHALACALLLLNTDLHGNITTKKMSMCEFIDNLAYTGFKYDRGLLKTLYAKIKSQPFKSPEQQPTEKPKKLSVQLGNNFVRQITDQVDYFHGWVMIKEVYDPPFGRRQWRMYFGTVRGLVLYLHKNERGFEASRFEVFQNCIRLHHSLAEIPRDYTKKSHVFRITTAKLGEYLVQTSSPEELSKWVNAVNFVAASLSTPALPEPTSSQSTARFHTSPLPSAVSSLSIRDQLDQHREKAAEIGHLLTILRESAPSIKAKGKPVYEYFYRERFLEREQLRYKTYIEILTRNLASSSRPESRNNFFHSTLKLSLLL
ncbi:hypothetical protein M3Y98_00771700 [Aphelenchoides besseyi]|nr:hypothetical protein M3Y98_00771700 [Aphelenchoides besseyi]